MRHKAFDSKFVISLERGEPIIEALTDFCRRRKINAGSFTGIGSCRGARLGFFDANRKKYRFKKFQGDYEIAALVGNISSMRGRPFVHAHAILGGRDFRAIAGHFKEAEVSAACEIVLITFAGTLVRKNDPASGTRQLDLE